MDRKLDTQSDLPQVGLGTWPLLGPPCRDAVERALTLGYRHIDTAQGFDNESEIGAGLRASGVTRDRIFITTKIWVEDLDETEVVRRCEDSLRRLGTDYLDLVLVHWPPRRAPLEVGLGALFDLKRRGTIRHVGVSNFPCRELAAAVSMGEIFCNQIEYHPYLAQPELTTFAGRNHVALVAHSPLAGGAISEDPTLVTIGDRHGKSPVQVALRWLVQQGITAIPKAAQAEHQRSNLDIFDFELDPDELDEIASLGRGLRIRDYPWSPQWDD